jgi:glycosyltransferase involved in cell wall biosynthesis
MMTRPAETPVADPLRRSSGLPVERRLKPLKVLFFVEGFTDIRFIVGLSRVCDLTMAVPSRTYEPSGLKGRIAESGARVAVEEIPGGRLSFQARSLGYLLGRARRFDVILAQEVLRGALNATLVGRLRGVPVVTYMGIAPTEYYRCRLERGQIGWLKWRFGDAVIRALMTVNGRLATRCLAMGPYLRDLALEYCPRSEVGLYYGVDADLFRPAGAEERAALRRKWGLPTDRFLIFFSSRISHEKDPETVLRATHLARRRGLDAVVLNLGGGYAEFLALARSMGFSDAAAWVLGGPAVHPMKEVADFFRASDVMALASLAEGAAYSTLEALASGTPVVATSVGGMAVQLQGHARLTPRRDAEAMAEQFLWVAANPGDARAQALRAREEYIIPQWRAQKAFEELSRCLSAVARRPDRGAGV